MKKNNLKFLILLFILILSYNTAYSQLFFPSKVGAFKNIEKGKLDKAQADFYKILKKDTASLLCRYGLALVYSDTRNESYNLDSAYLYSTQSQRFIPEFTNNGWLSSNISKDELKDIGKLHIATWDVVSYRDTITARIFNVEKTKNNSTVLKKFIEKHPNAKETDKAWELIYSIDYNNANQINTVEGYQKYINEYPKSKFIPNAKSDMYLVAYNNATKANTIETYKQYIKDYPKSQYLDSVNIKLEGLYYKEALRINTIKGYNSFLEIYKNSRYYDDVRFYLDRLMLYNPKYKNDLIKECRKKGLKGISYLKSFIDNDFLSLPIEKRDSICLIFNSIYDDLIYNANFDSSIDYPRIDKINNPDIEFTDAQKELIKNTNNDIMEYGVMIDENHRNGYCEIPNFITNLFKEKISEAMFEYMNRVKSYVQDVINSGMHPYYSMDQDYENSVFWDNFISKYPNFFLIEEIKESYSAWLNSLFYGEVYDPAFPEENNNILRTERKVFLEKIIKKNEATNLTRDIIRFYNELKTTNFKNPEYVKALHNTQWLIGSWVAQDNFLLATGKKYYTTNEVINFINDNTVEYKGEEYKFTRDENYIKFIAGGFSFNIKIDYMRQELQEEVNGEIWGSYIKGIIDVDGNLYRTIKIGSQTWLAENLRTTKLNNGTPLKYLPDDKSWTNCKYSSTPAFCWYDNNITNKDTYGAIYNGYAIETGKLAPKGWHIANSSDWYKLFAFFSENENNFNVGECYPKIAKSIASREGWVEITDESYINCPGYQSVLNNSSGFNALPGGFRRSDSEFIGLGKFAHWYSSSSCDDVNNFYSRIELNYNSICVGINDNDGIDCIQRNVGLYVRCVKDEY